MPTLGLDWCRSELDAYKPMQCATCQEDRSFRWALDYELFHLYGNIGLVLSKRHLLFCTTCGTEVEPAATDSRPPASIPFAHRYGLAVLVATTLVLILIMQWVVYPEGLE